MYGKLKKIDKTLKIDKKKYKMIADKKLKKIDKSVQIDKTHKK